jgi:hypothetical protein
MSTERSDAAVVYRWLRAVSLEGGTSVDEIAFQCFPTMYGREDPAYRALARRGVTRVLDSLVWLRGQGVVVLALPARDDELTRYVVVLQS